MHNRSLALRQAAAFVILALGAAFSAAPALAQDAQSQQVLDRVFTYNTGAVLSLTFSNVLPGAEVNNLDLSTNLITACALTPVDGLWCLDGSTLRRWPNPLDPTVRVDEFSCTDAALGFDTLVPTACTGMTVDKSGVIWLSGKKKLPNNWPNRPWWISEQVWMALQTWFNPYSVVKVTKKGPNACPSGTQQLAGKPYCAAEAFTGKYLVTRLSPVDGDAAKAFKPCADCAAQSGVLGVEDFRNILFFPSGSQNSIPVTGGWTAGLKFGEVLDDVSFLVVNGQSNVLATTSLGRVLAKNTATGGTPGQAFNIPTERAPGSVKCSIVPSQFAIRSAASSAVVFVADRQYCQVSALVPTSATNLTLVNLQKTGGGDLTLVTKDDANFPIFGLTVAPGMSVDLGGCTSNCAIVNGAAGKPAAQLFDVKVVDTHKGGATIFQLKNIPDCRYAADPDFLPADVTLCNSLPGVVVNPPGNGPFQPAAQLLNATKLLSGDVVNAFTTRGIPLPDLLISRQYRGQKGNHFRFGALFIIPTQGVKYKGILSSEYDVPALQGGTSVPPEQDFRCKVPSDPQLSDLLAWNVTTAVSETYLSIGGKYIDSLANSGCGSIKGEYGRLSLLPYDLEIVPDTYAPTVLWPFAPKFTKDNDAVFARLASSLIDDLGYVFKEQACKQVDQGPQPPSNTLPPSPLPSSVCNPYSAASEQLALLRYKFDRCLIGAFTNKYVDDHLPGPLRNRPYCGYALDRLNDFQAALPLRDTTDPVNDIANRLGELHSRIDILRHLYTTRFQPSIPDRGYCKELNICSYNHDYDH